MRVSEIILEVEVDAACEVAKKSMGHTGRADIFSQIVICSFSHADILAMRTSSSSYVRPDTWRIDHNATITEKHTATNLKRKLK